MELKCDLLILALLIKINMMKTHITCGLPVDKPRGMFAVSGSRSVAAAYYAYKP